MPEIPHSPLLSEAEPQSLQELFSEDPFHYTQQKKERVVAEMRALAERLALATANGTKPKAAKAGQEPIPVDPSSLGF